MLVSLRKPLPSFMGVRLPTRKPPVVLENVSKVAPKPAPTKAAAPTQLSPAGVTDPSKSATSTPSPTVTTDPAAAANRVQDMVDRVLNQISRAASHAALTVLGILAPKPDAAALSAELEKRAAAALEASPAAAVVAATTAVQMAINTNTTHAVKKTEGDPIDTVVVSTAARIVVATPDAAVKLGAPATVSVVTGGVTAVPPAVATVNPAAFAPPPSVWVNGGGASVSQFRVDGGGAPVSQIQAASGYAQAGAALVPTADPNSVRSAPL